MPVLYPGHSGTKPISHHILRSVGEPPTSRLLKDPEGLVAAMIAQGGLRCEREGMHEQVLPYLHRWVADLKPI